MPHTPTTTGQRRLIWVIVAIALVVATFVVVMNMTGRSNTTEPGLFPSSRPSPSGLEPTRDWIGYELVPIADEARKRRVLSADVPRKFECSYRLGDTYFARIPPPDHVNAYSKLDITGDTVTVKRLSDGSVQIMYSSYHSRVTAFLLGDDVVYAPSSLPEKYWINPESFGPITESKIGLCTRLVRGK